MYDGYAPHFEPCCSYCCRPFGNSTGCTCHGSLLTSAKVISPNRPTLFPSHAKSPIRSAAKPTSCIDRPGGTAAATPGRLEYVCPFQMIVPLGIRRVALQEQLQLLLRCPHALAPTDLAARVLDQRPNPFLHRRMHAREVLGAGDDTDVDQT